MQRNAKKVRGLRRLLYNGSMSKENDRCELRKYNLAIYTFVENGQYTFVFAEDGCVVPASCGDMPIFRVGNSLSQALSRLRMDKYPFFRLRLKMLAKRQRSCDKTWYWRFRAIDKEWLAEVELLSESSCVWRIWTTPK